ncbi:MAG: hypothetical protein WAP03_20590 [Methylorubrum rhodinum]|uniref:hypothetical protein n=1 Tax=Methylorubrum rhodinum TaxID=29428 RepID=UPI003BB174AC
MFGRKESGKPRAAWFGASDIKAVTQAASVMKMRTLPLATDDQRAFARTLSAGRVFASGRAFTPFVRKDLYARLVEIAGGSTGRIVAIPPPSTHSGAKSDA